MYKKVSKGEQISYATLSNEECTVVFPSYYRFFAVKGDNIIAAFHNNIIAKTDGVYEPDSGVIYMTSGIDVNTIYIKGSGDCTIWGGDSMIECPFKSEYSIGTINIIPIATPTPVKIEGRNGDVWLS